MNKNIELSHIALRRKNVCVLDYLPDAQQNYNNIDDTNSFLEFVPEESKNVIFAATLAKKMENIGYIPSRELFEIMLTDSAVTAKISEYAIPELLKLKGADVEYNAMYRGFPFEVMEKSEAELYTNAILHYLTNGQLMPATHDIERKELNQNVKLKEIGLGNINTLTDIFSNLLNSSSPWTPQDTEDLKSMIKEFNVENYSPEFMVNRENMAVLTKNLAEFYSFKKAIDIMDSHIKTPNDVLRIMNTIHGDGDATLSEKINIKNISRVDRKIYLGLLENMKHVENEDVISGNYLNQINTAESIMKERKKVWFEIANRRLHPTEFSLQFPKTNKAFGYIRDNEKLKNIKTYNGICEEVIKSMDTDLLNKFFKDKPGMLARNLDRLIRNAEDEKSLESVLKCWENVSCKVAPTLLWQVHSHFKRKINELNDENRKRVFVTAKKMSSSLAVPDNTKPIPKKISKSIINITENALRECYKNKPEMGKVYIEDAIKKCKIPNETRGRSQTSESLGHGSRLPMDKDTNIIRGFIWWTNPENGGRTDIDLSAAFLDKDLNSLGRVSYYELKTDFAVHSGDIVDGGACDGDGAAEFVDVDINKAVEKGVKYVCFSVNSFSYQPFSEMEHIRFGFMERESFENGEIFEPKTVKQVSKLSAPATINMPCLFDLESKEMIWMDEGSSCHELMAERRVPNNIDNNFKGAQMLIYKNLHLEKPDIYDVIRINAEARNGQIVENKEDADIIFALDEGIRPVDLDYFSGNLIPKEVSKEFCKQEIGIMPVGLEYSSENLMPRESESLMPRETSKEFCKQEIGIMPVDFENPFPFENCKEEVEITPDEFEYSFENLMLREAEDLMRSTREDLKAFGEEEIKEEKADISFEEEYR